MSHCAYRNKEPLLLSWCWQWRRQCYWFFSAGILSCVWMCWGVCTWFCTGRRFGAGRCSVICSTPSVFSSVIQPDRVGGLTWRFWIFLKKIMATKIFNCKSKETHRYWSFGRIKEDGLPAEEWPQRRLFSIIWNTMSNWFTHLIACKSEARAWIKCDWIMNRRNP